MIELKVEINITQDVVNVAKDGYVGLNIGLLNSIEYACLQRGDWLAFNFGTLAIFSTSTQIFSNSDHPLIPVAASIISVTGVVLLGLHENPLYVISGAVLSSVSLNYLNRKFKILNPLPLLNQR